MKHLINSYFEWHFKDRYYYLLISILLFLVLPPFTISFWFGKFLIYLLLSFVIITCVLILFDHSKYSTYGIGLLIVSLIITWFTLSPIFSNNVTAESARGLLLLVLFSTTAIKVVQSIFRLKKINARVLAASVGAYLLLGLAGAMLFGLINLFYPGSFNYDFQYGSGYDMMYYSFVTLSTLGYGDITPQTTQGQAAAILVSITGQLYLAILMAMLVGKFLKDSDW
ncbi:MAG: two pore domain potassium channel family protein [Cyclobacteriaceae bacterium]|nr:two pore domain potassium channel family protein [Cyclobacteriaceae bacterium]